MITILIQIKDMVMSSVAENHYKGFSLLSSTGGNKIDFINPANLNSKEIINLSPMAEESMDILETLMIIKRVGKGDPYEIESFLSDVLGEEELRKLKGRDEKALEIIVSNLSNRDKIKEAFKLKMPIESAKFENDLWNQDLDTLSDGFAKKIEKLSKDPSIDKVEFDKARRRLQLSSYAKQETAYVGSFKYSVDKLKSGIDMVFQDETSKNICKALVVAAAAYHGLTFGLIAAAPVAALFLLKNEKIKQGVVDFKDKVFNFLEDRGFPFDFIDKLKSKTVHKFYELKRNKAVKRVAMASALIAMATIIGPEQASHLADMTQSTIIDYFPSINNGIENIGTTFAPVINTVRDVKDFLFELKDYVNEEYVSGFKAFISNNFPSIDSFIDMSKSISEQLAGTYNFKSIDIINDAIDSSKNLSDLGSAAGSLWVASKVIKSGSSSASEVIDEFKSASNNETILDLAEYQLGVSASFIEIQNRAIEIACKYGLKEEDIYKPADKNLIEEELFNNGLLVANKTSKSLNESFMKRKLSSRDNNSCPENPEL